jgi:hypothetical protein
MGYYKYKYKYHRRTLLLPPALYTKELCTIWSFLWTIPQIRVGYRIDQAGFLMGCDYPVRVCQVSRPLPRRDTRRPTGWGMGWGMTRLRRFPKRMSEYTVYNPKNIPLNWDGKPMPYWLYKLHGLQHYHDCQICGGETYRGRRNFELHFADQKHALGMKSLGIANTKHFHGVTAIDDAML